MIGLDHPIKNMLMIFGKTWPELSKIALQVMEQEKRERELRREWFSKWDDSRPQGTFGTWNISDRH